MKVLTYGTYGGVVPDVVVKFLSDEREPGKPCPDMHVDQDLVTLVESFRNEPFVDEGTMRANPGKLYPHKAKACVDGITRTVYYGWASPDPLRAIGGVAAQVCVNEYREGEVKTTITEYDGAESLSLLPEYEPVEGAFGLYRRKRRRP